MNPLVASLGARRVARHPRQTAAPTLDQRSVFRLQCGPHRLTLGRRTLVMGILNVTPDSFSDGGRFLSSAAAIAQGEQMAAEGADLIDIGGESTRPGAPRVNVEEERARVLPVIRALARRVHLPLSIDTSKAAVAEAALDAGCAIVNDVTALRGDRRMAEVIARAKAPVILMHMRGTPRTMQQHARYRMVETEVVAELRQAIRRAIDAGIAEECLLVDPGLGFAKTAAQNLRLLRRLDALQSLGRPVVVGPSRKSFIGAVLDAPVEERLMGTAATVALAIAGGAHIVRVHDVRAMAQVARMADAIRNAATP